MYTTYTRTRVDKCASMCNMCVRACVYMRACTYARVCACVRACVCVRAYVCAGVRVCVCAFVSDSFVENGIKMACTSYSANNVHEQNIIYTQLCLTLFCANIRYDFLVQNGHFVLTCLIESYKHN